MLRRFADTSKSPSVEEGVKRLQINIKRSIAISYSAESSRLSSPVHTVLGSDHEHPTTVVTAMESGGQERQGVPSQSNDPTHQIHKIKSLWAKLRDPLIVSLYNLAIRYLASQSNQTRRF